jgi:hypothetical protein
MLGNALLLEAARPGTFYALKPKANNLLPPLR